MNTAENVIENMIENKQPKNTTTFLFSREGNKNRYAKKIINLFCNHKIYIEPFAGLGAVFFNKINNTKINILNDSSNFIFDLLTKMSSAEGYTDLLKNLENKIMHFDLLKADDSVEAKILLITSTFKGAAETGSFELNAVDYKKITVDNFKKWMDLILPKLQKNTKIIKKDYIVFLDSLQNDLKNRNTLIYCDPPYSEKKGRLKDNAGWSGLSSLRQLIETLLKLNCNFAISEMAGFGVFEVFKSYNLKINFISKNTGGHNKNNKKTSMEILATNYEPDFTNDIFNEEILKD
jgi:site-specific DNA-adenine methylase